MLCQYHITSLVLGRAESEKFDNTYLLIDRLLFMFIDQHVFDVHNKIIQAVIIKGGEGKQTDPGQSVTVRGGTVGRSIEVIYFKESS